MTELDIAQGKLRYNRQKKMFECRVDFLWLSYWKPFKADRYMRFRVTSSVIQGPCSSPWSDWIIINKGDILSYKAIGSPQLQGSYHLLISEILGFDAHLAGSSSLINEVKLG